MSVTFGKAILNALRQAAQYNRDDMVPPVAVLWPDKSCEWADIVPHLGDELPVLSLGNYKADLGVGPAIWIRCMLARMLPDADWSIGTVPIIYLPGYSRSDLRAVEECPEELKPIAELQYRGVVWSQTNGRDWTLAAFIQSSYGGLGISIGADALTRKALRRASVKLMDEPLKALQANEPLRAGYFDSLLTPDLTRLVLRWMNDPSKTKAEMSDDEWAAFCSKCEVRLGLNPEQDGEITAAQKLGKKDGNWTHVWERFIEAPARYPNIPALLKAAKPNPKNLFERMPAEPWPQDNESQEVLLRQSLALLSNGSLEDARKEIQRLEKSHGMRRQWVWTQLGHSPLANALKHLEALAELTSRDLISGSVDSLVQDYFTQGWKVDSAVVNALKCVRTNDDLLAVSTVLDVLYKPWLRDTAEQFQAAWTKSPPKTMKTTTPPEPGVVYLFVDGLRMDTGFGLKNRLETQGFDCIIKPKIASLPSITETGKPAVSPVAGEFFAGPELSPTTREGTMVDARVLRSVLSELGFEVLRDDETGDPQSCAWAECGRLDEIGHIEGCKLAWRIDDELNAVFRRVCRLLDAGWKEVRVLTDHGWLLLPSGLPSHSLYEKLTDVRKGRCARLKLDADPHGVITIPWFWDSLVVIAIPPGIRCFVAGKQYEHGGISPQEIVVPELAVCGTQRFPSVQFTKVAWSGMRCRVTLEGNTIGMRVDLRLKPADPSSSVVDSGKAIPQDLQVSLVCEDDSLEGTPAVLVVHSDSKPDRVVSQYATFIGGREY